MVSDPSNGTRRLTPLGGSVHVESKIASGENAVFVTFQFFGLQYIAVSIIWPFVFH